MFFVLAAWGSISPCWPEDSLARTGPGVEPRLLSPWPSQISDFRIRCTSLGLLVSLPLPLASHLSPPFILSLSLSLSLSLHIVALSKRRSDLRTISNNRHEILNNAHLPRPRLWSLHSTHLHSSSLETHSESTTSNHYPMKGKGPYPQQEGREWLVTRGNKPLMWATDWHPV